MISRYSLQTTGFRAVTLSILTAIVSFSFTPTSAQQHDLHQCEIDTAQSLVQIRVYKDGRLAALGDNHLISTSSLTGKIEIHSENIEKSNISVSVATKSLEVNNPQLRAKAEPGFNSKVSNLNRRITRKSMLGPKVLDAKQYPVIDIDFTHIPPSGAGQAELEIHLHGVRNKETTDILVSYENDLLSASGQLFVSQKRYGIEPFSILFGGIQVKDQLRLDFHVVATCH